VEKGGMGAYLLCLLAGAVNGFFGMGAGMILVLGLQRIYRIGREEIMAISTFFVLSFSLLTTILYFVVGHVKADAVMPLLVPSLLGGALGSLLLGRIRPVHLQVIFSLLLLISGARLLFL
jgi:uncharacterized membrane protein YfcA